MEYVHYPLIQYLLHSVCYQSFNRETFSSPENQAVSRKLVDNSLPLLPNSTAATLKGMCNNSFVHHIYVCLAFFAEATKTYYNSAAGTERLKLKGKYTMKCVQQRRRNRLKRVRINTFPICSGYSYVRGLG